MTHVCMISLTVHDSYLLINSVNLEPCTCTFHCQPMFAAKSLPKINTTLQCDEEIELAPLQDFTIVPLKTSSDHQSTSIDSQLKKVKSDILLLKFQVNSTKLSQENSKLKICVIFVLLTIISILLVALICIVLYLFLQNYGS